MVPRPGTELGLPGRPAQPPSGEPEVERKAGEKETPAARTRPGQDGGGGGGSGIVTRSTAAARFVRRYCSRCVPKAPIRLWVTSSSVSSAVPMSSVPLTPKVPITAVGYFLAASAFSAIASENRPCQNPFIG